MTKDKAEVWWEYGMAKAQRHSSWGGDWSKLEIREREAAALWKFEADVANGGFLQFFCNWGYEAYQWAIEALENIQARQTLELVQAAYAVIARLENEEMSGLHDIYRLLEDEEIQQLAVIDHQLWNCTEMIGELAYDYFCKTDMG